MSGMRWQNSPNIRDALEAMLDALKRHNRDVSDMIYCKQRVKDAEAELEKAELRASETKDALISAQATLRDEGFITNDSVYEP